MVIKNYHFAVSKAKEDFTAVPLPSKVTFSTKNVGTVCQPCMGSTKWKKNPGNPY